MQRHVREFFIPTEDLLRLLTPTAPHTWLTIVGEPLPEDAEVVGLRAGADFSVSGVLLLIHSATYGGDHLHNLPRSPYPQTQILTHVNVCPSGCAS